MTNNPHNTDNQSDMSTTTGNSWTPFAAKQGMWTDGTGDTSGFSHIVRLPARIVPLARPFGGDLDAIFDRLFTLVPEVADAPVTTFTDMPTIYIPREHLLKTMQALRDDEELRYELCTSISGVHYPTEKDAELHSVYHLLSMSHNRRLRVEVVCPAAEPHIPSVVRIYPGANYHERETWDMFGIIFDGHPGLTLGVTLISTVSHSIMNPTEWTLAVPLIGLVAAVVTTGGSVGIIRSRHPSATLAYGMIAAAVIFFLVILGYYFGYAR